MLTRILSFSLQELVLNFSDFRTTGLAAIQWNVIYLGTILQIGGQQCWPNIRFRDVATITFLVLTCGWDNTFSETWPRFFSEMWQCAKRKIRVVGQALISAVQSITDVNCTNLILHWPLTRNWKCERIERFLIIYHFQVWSLTRNWKCKKIEIFLIIYHFILIMPLVLVPDSWLEMWKV